MIVNDFDKYPGSDVCKFFKELQRATETDSIVVMDTLIGGTDAENYFIRGMLVVKTFSGYFLFLKLQDERKGLLFQLEYEIPSIIGVRTLPQDPRCSEKVSYLLECKNLHMNRHTNRYERLFEGLDSEMESSIKAEHGEELGRFIMQNRTTLHKVTILKRY